MERENFSLYYKFVVIVYKTSVSHTPNRRLEDVITYKFLIHFYVIACR